MKIAGLNKTTLLDYPEHVSATVFTAGCNFCCPFCHNSDLVTKSDLAILAEEAVLAFLEKRKKILTGVCITGGEPALQPDLKGFLYKVKKKGYQVKLDTNGYRPDVVEDMLAEGLVDYIAMDIKNSKEKYAKTAGYTGLDIGIIEESIEQIKGCGVPYEFRTTVVKELHMESDLMEIGDWIGDNSPYYLQSYEENENVIKKGFHAYQAEELRRFRDHLTDRGIKAMLRGLG